MVGGVLPLPGASERWIHTMPKIVTKQASDNPILFYKHFLENTVLTHPELVRASHRAGRDDRRHRAHPGTADRAWRRWWDWCW